MVIDEAHTLESERGHLIELLLLKLRSLNPHLQVIALSATLSSPVSLAHWLHAQLYLFPSAPSVFSESIVSDGRVTTLDGFLQRTLQSRDRASSFLELVGERVANGDSVLVFCPTKAQSELAAQRAATVLPPLSAARARQVRKCLHGYKQRHITPFDPFLENLLLHGVGIHHAGLADAERVLVEALFRRRCLLVLAATSTLSAGVNLNVDTVIVDGIRRCGQMYSPTEYAQMIGRTGRMGQAKRGTVLVLVDPCDERMFRYQIRSRSDVEIRRGNYVRTRWCWCRILLEVVALGIETRLNKIIELVRRSSYFSYMPARSFYGMEDELGKVSTLESSLDSPVDSPVESLVESLVESNSPSPIQAFFSSSYHGSVGLFDTVQCNGNSLEIRVASWLSPSIDPHLYELVSSLCWLVHNQFLSILSPTSNTSNTSTTSTTSYTTSMSSSSLTLRCCPTELGEASFLSRLNVSEVASLALSLSQLSTRMDMSNSLQIVYHLTPLSPELHIPLAAAQDYVNRYLTEAEMRFADHEILSLQVLTALREGCIVESLSEDTQNRLKRFLACLVVSDLLRFDSLEHTKEIFGLSKGVLQGVQTAFKVFYHINMRVLKCLHYDLLYDVFKGFEMHVATDLTPETLALVNLGVVAWLVHRHAIGRDGLRSSSNEQWIHICGKHPERRVDCAGHSDDGPNAMEECVLRGRFVCRNRKRVYAV